MIQAVAEANDGKKLLALVHPGVLSEDAMANIKEFLKSYEERYNIEFVVLCEGMRIVDPCAPTGDSRKSKTLELTDKELDEIESWYQSAAGESATGGYCTLRKILGKFGFTPHYMDETHLDDKPRHEEEEVAA